MIRTPSMAALLTASLLLPASTLLSAAPPATEARPIEETLHGTKLVDPYRWLEGDAKGAVTPEVATWTDAQNAHTRAVLDNLPGRAAVEARIKELLQIGSVTAPDMRGNRYFYTKREGAQNQPVLYLREGHDGTPRVLLDPNTLDAAGLVSMAFAEASQDGKRLAFGIYRSGDENAVLHVLDVDSGKWLAEEIPGKVGGVAWLPDGTGFFYRRLADTKDPYSAQIKFHRLGTHHRQDSLLFRQYTKEEDPKLATTWGPYLNVSKDARWGILSYFTSTRSNDLWVVDLDRYFRTGAFERVEIIRGSDSTSSGVVQGDTLYMFTTDGAPSGRLVAVNLNNPGRDGWKELVATRKDVVIEGHSLARGLLVVQTLKSAQNRIELYDTQGKFLSELALPGIGTASVATEDDRTEAFVTFTSFNEPTSIYRVDLKSRERTLWERPAVPVDPSTVEVKQVFYPSKDGTRISMFVVHKKGLKYDGTNPTILHGYGGFNSTETPRFSATLFQWYDAGGVYALPNLRGGGEYGDSWHVAGILEKKQNTFDDFIAAAEWLIANKVTQPARLAISGGSNGGLLTGATLTQRPELFSAVLCQVPLLDMLRYQNFLMARYWVPEYGSAEDAKQFGYLLKYSPYQNVRKGTKYPAVFLTAGENDTRVHPLHARKMAALLQSASASDAAEKPVLLWVDREAGHGQGKPLNLRARDAADTRMFLMWQLGMLKK